MLKHFILALTLFTSLSVCAQQKTINETLKEELEQIFANDQKVRTMYFEALKTKGNDSDEVRLAIQAMQETDLLNRDKVISIINKHGWLGPNEVGRLASNTISIVFIHTDLETKKKYLPMMREAVKNKRARADDVAYMEDKIAIAEGRKQIYGTQFILNENGKFKLSSIEDPENVDARRAKVGLEPLAEYLKQSNLSLE